MGYVLHLTLHIRLLANVALDGLSSITRTEGVRGLYKGTSLALFGVSNGAIQFMAYEKMKVWGFDRKRARLAKQGKQMADGEDKLVRGALICEY